MMGRDEDEEDDIFDQNVPYRGVTNNQEFIKDTPKITPDIYQYQRPSQPLKERDWMDRD